jgi:alanine racemase
MSYPEKQLNMVRAGIGVYGLMPDLPLTSNFSPLTLKQVIGLKGRITRIHTMRASEGISYGHTFVADKDIKVATVPIGYADGVPRLLSNKIWGLVNGKKVKQIGNITMDQIMFDITGIDVQEGEAVTLLGDGLSIDEWARILCTINYELTCRLKVRLQRVYTR